MVWLIVSSTYNTIIIGLVVLLAVQTRHIKQGNFKDTKKVNVFAATTIIILVLFLLLGYVFQSVDRFYSLSHFFLCIAVLSVALDCQLFLFVPKILPQVFKNIDVQKSLANQNAHAASCNGTA